MQELAMRAVAAYAGGDDEAAESYITWLYQLKGLCPQDIRHALVEAGFAEAIAVRMANLALRKKPTELKILKRRLRLYVEPMKADQLVAVAFAEKAKRNAKYRATIYKRALRNAPHAVVWAAFDAAGITAVRSIRHSIPACSMLQATKG